MASLRRMASLDCVTYPSSNPVTPGNHHLIRHSSLPNLFLCQTELAVGALNRYSFLNKGSLLFNECRTVPKSALSVCRAMPSSRLIDETPDFEGWPVDANLDNAAESGFSENAHRPHAVHRKERPIVAAGLDLEKSVVYSELRESFCSLKVPPGFFQPYDMGVKAFSERGKCFDNRNQAMSDLHMQKSCGGGNGNDVKDRPMSLRMLKRKSRKVSLQDAGCDNFYKEELVEEICASEMASHCGAASRPLSNVGDSVFSAFASLLYMLKMLQQYSPSPFMQYNISCSDVAHEKSHQNWVGRTYAEMLDSFVWLFQQVFSCTPKLMLLIMMLLADFTLHSVSKHVALPVMALGEPPTMLSLLHHAPNSTNMINVGATTLRVDVNKQYGVTKKHGFKEDIFEEILPGEHGGGGRDGSVGRVIKHGGGLPYGSRDFTTPCSKMTSKGKVSRGYGDDLGEKISTSPSLTHHVVDDGLDATTKTMMVAPVRAPTLEADDYPCFDQTDLSYQQEISMDPSNPLLLANYAQFLHVVRQDNGRAEKLYRRAMMVDADGDGEVMGRFASFLWVVKGDVVEAESAYKAAVDADPANVYHAGCYANFLWSSSASQAEETSSCCSVMDNLGTISS